MYLKALTQKMEQPGIYKKQCACFIFVYSD